MEIIILIIELLAAFIFGTILFTIGYSIGDNEGYKRGEEENY